MNGYDIMTEKSKQEFEKYIDDPINFHQPHKSRWEHEDRHLFELMLQGEKISIEGINTLQVKRDQRRLSAKISNTPAIQKSPIQATCFSDASGDTNDSDFSPSNSPQPKKRKKFKRGLDFKPVLLQGVRYGNSDRNLVDVTKSFSMVHNLDESYWFTKSTINRHQIALREDVLKRHEVEILELSSSNNSAVNLHFDGFGNIEGALAKWSLPDRDSSVETPLAIKEYRDSPDGLTVFEFLKDLVEKFELKRTLVSIAADTTALNSGVAGKGCLHRLDISETGKQLHVFRVLCQIHSNELFNGVFLTHLSEDAFGPIPACQKGTSTSDQSIKLLVNNFYELQSYDNDIIWKNITSSSSLIHYPKDFAPLNKANFNNAKFSGCHKLIFECLTKNAISRNDLDYVFIEQSVRFMGYLSAMTQIVLLKSPLKKNLKILEKDADNQRISDLARNTIDMLDKWQAKHTIMLLNLGKLAFSTYWDTAQNDFFSIQKTAIKTTSAYANFFEHFPVKKKIADSLEVKLVKTANAQAYNCSSIFLPLDPNSQSIVNEIITEGYTFADAQISFRDCVRNATDNSFTLEELQQLAHTDFYDQNLIMNSPVFHQLLARGLTTKQKLKEIYASDYETWSEWYKSTIVPIYNATSIHNQSAERMLSLVKRANGNFAKLLLAVEARNSLE